MHNPNEISISLTFDMSTDEGREDYNTVTEMVENRSRPAYEKRYGLIDNTTEGPSLRDLITEGNNLLAKLFGPTKPENIDPGRSSSLLVSKEKQNTADLAALLKQHPSLSSQLQAPLRGWAGAILSSPESTRGFPAQDQQIEWHTEPGSGLLHIILTPIIPDVPKGESAAPLSEDTPAPGADDEDGDDFFD